MKKYNELSKSEQREVMALLSCWLKQAVSCDSCGANTVAQVLEKRDEIVNNKGAMELLQDLKKIKEQQQKELEADIETLLEGGKMRGSFGNWEREKARRAILEELRQEYILK